MISYLNNPRVGWFGRSIMAFVVIAFVLGSVVPPTSLQAQMISSTPLGLSAPGAMVPVSVEFAPAIVKGLTIHPENPLEFDFIVDTGDDQWEDEAFKDEASKLIKYFLASLTVPEDQMWVNLSPYEKERIIPDGLGVTELGRDLLAQDYLLKQLTASLVYPEDELGRKFWDKIKQKAREMYGTDDIPVDTFNKVWIVPDKAVVYEYQNHVFVVERHLRVMLEEDYVALSHHGRTQDTGHTTQDKDGLKTSKGMIEDNATPLASREQRGELGVSASQGENSLGAGRKALGTLSSELIRELIIPELEREVNEGKNFAKLRQIYNSMILATWFKKNLKNGLLGRVYVDRNKVKGVDIPDANVKQQIYDQYIEAFKAGVYNYIKEDYDPASRQLIPRKYFSGGMVGIDKAMLTEIEGPPEEQDPAMIAAVSTPKGKYRGVRWVAGERAVDPVALNRASDAAMAGKREQQKLLELQDRYRFDQAGVLRLDPRLNGSPEDILRMAVGLLLRMEQAMIETRRDIRDLRRDFSKVDQRGQLGHYADSLQKSIEDGRKFFGQFLSFNMDAYEMSAAQLARKAGLSHHTISRILQGFSSLKIDRFLGLIESFSSLRSGITPQAVFRSLDEQKLTDVRMRITEVTARERSGGIPAALEQRLQDSPVLQRLRHEAQKLEQVIQERQEAARGLLSTIWDDRRDPSINDFLSGKRVMTARHLAAVARASGVAIDELWPREDLITVVVPGAGESADSVLIENGSTSFRDYQDWRRRSVFQLRDALVDAIGASSESVYRVLRSIPFETVYQAFIRRFNLISETYRSEFAKQWADDPDGAVRWMAEGKGARTKHVADNSGRLKIWLSEPRSQSTPFSVDPGEIPAELDGTFIYKNVNIAKNREMSVEWFFVPDLSRWLPFSVSFFEDGRPGKPLPFLRVVVDKNRKIDRVVSNIKRKKLSGELQGYEIFSMFPSSRGVSYGQEKLSSGRRRGYYNFDERPGQIYRTLVGPGGVMLYFHFLGEQDPEILKEIEIRDENNRLIEMWDAVHEQVAENNILDANRQAMEKESHVVVSHLPLSRTGSLYRFMTGDVEFRIPAALAREGGIDTTMFGEVVYESASLPEEVPTPVRVRVGRYAPWSAAGFSKLSMRIAAEYALQSDGKSATATELLSLDGDAAMAGETEFTEEEAIAFGNLLILLYLTDRYGGPRRWTSEEEAALGLMKKFVNGDPGGLFADVAVRTTPPTNVASLFYDLLPEDVRKSIGRLRTDESREKLKLLTEVVSSNDFVASGRRHDPLRLQDDSVLERIQTRLSKVLSEGQEDRAMAAGDPVGGINLNAAMMDLQIKRDEQGVPLPLGEQSLDNINIEGLYPIIINVTPVSVPMLLGLLGHENPSRAARQKRQNGDLGYEKNALVVLRKELAFVD